MKSWQLIVLCLSAAVLYSEGKFTVEYEDGRRATYELLPMELDQEGEDLLFGGQSTVRKATVLGDRKGVFEFNVGDTVIVKAANHELINKDALNNEREVRKIIKAKRPDGIAGIPKVEGFGKSKDLNKINEPTWNPEVPQDEYELVVMQCLGMNLDHYSNYHLKHNVEVVVKKFIMKIGKIIDAMNDIDLVHGDIKPDNILLNTSNDPNGEIFVTDFGLTIILHSQFVTGPAGDIRFMSWMMLFPPTRRATPSDDKESLVFTEYFMICLSLPWLKHADCLKAKNCEDMKQSYMLMQDLKLTCDFEPFPETVRKISDDTKASLKKGLKSARANDQATVQEGEKLYKYRQQFGGDTAKSNNPKTITPSALAALDSGLTY